MRLSSCIYIFFLAVVPLAAYPAAKTFVCHSPEGMRVDYFSSNNLNLENNKFILGKDHVSGMYPQIILQDDNQNVSFLIGDSTEIKSSPKQVNMKVLAYNSDQISFTGIVNDAPILATFYPKANVLIYSQQSTWANDNLQGARAILFYAICSPK